MTASDLPDLNDLSFFLVELLNAKRLIGGVDDATKQALTGENVELNTRDRFTLFYPVEVIQLARGVGQDLTTPTSLFQLQRKRRSRRLQEHIERNATVDTSSLFNLFYVYLPHSDYVAPREPRLTLAYSAIALSFAYPLSKDEQLTTLYDFELNDTPTVDDEPDETQTPRQPTARDGEQVPVSFRGLRTPPEGVVRRPNHGARPCPEQRHG